MLRTALLALAFHALLPSAADAQTLQPAAFVELARRHYAAGHHGRAGETLAAGIRRHSDVAVLRRWRERLEEEVASGSPAPVLDLVRQPTPPVESSARVSPRPEARVARGSVPRQEWERAPPGSRPRVRAAGRRGGNEFVGLLIGGGILMVGGGVAAIVALLEAFSPCISLALSRPSCSAGDTDTAAVVGGIGAVGFAVGLILVATGALVAQRSRSVRATAGPGDLGLGLEVVF